MISCVAGFDVIWLYSVTLVEWLWTEACHFPFASWLQGGITDVRVYHFMNDKILAAQPGNVNMTEIDSLVAVSS